MSYPPKNLVHVDGRWYLKGKEPKNSNVKIVKQSSTDELKSKPVTKSKLGEDDKSKSMDSDKSI